MGGPGLEASFRPGASPAYHIEHLEKARPIYQKVIKYAQAMGLDMIEGDYEDEGQIELNWMYDHADLTADRLVTYRQICKQVARARHPGQLHAQALHRPDGQRLPPQLQPLARRREHPGGGGCPRAPPDRRGQARPRRRADPRGRLDDGDGADRQLLQALLGRRAVRASKINWGLDNKTCTVRLSANGRLEFKLPDAAVNPYLAHTILIAACEDGLKNQIDPASRRSASSYDQPQNEAFPPLPLTMGEAIEAFRADTVIRRPSATTSDLLLAYHEDEWARYCGQVSEWERTMYWDDTP